MEEKIIDRLLSITGGAMLLNGKQLAQALGLDATTISTLKRQGAFGIPVLTGTGKRDKYSIASVVRYLLGQAQPKAPIEPTETSHKQRKSRTLPNGLPTLEMIRNRALKHFSSTLEEQAHKNLEVADFLNKMIAMEELDKELSSKKEVVKITKI